MIQTVYIFNKGTYAGYVSVTHFSGRVYNYTVDTMPATVKAFINAAAADNFYSDVNDSGSYYTRYKKPFRRSIVNLMTEYANITES